MHQQVELAGAGKSMRIVSARPLNVESNVGPCTMDDVLFCPDANQNLLSLSRLDDKGYASTFSDGYYLFKKSLLTQFLETHGSESFFHGDHDGQLYKLSVPLRVGDQPATCT